MTIIRTIGAYHDASNARIRKIGQFTGPASYTTAGDPLTPAEIGMGRVEVRSQLAEGLGKYFPIFQGRRKRRLHRKVTFGSTKCCSETSS